VGNTPASNGVGAEKVAYDPTMIPGTSMEIVSMPKSTDDLLNHHKFTFFSPVVTYNFDNGDVGWF